MTRILVTGGTGFIGRAVVARLSAAGCRVTVPTRRLERARHLLVLPGIRVVEATIHEDGALAALLDGQDAVINLAAILQGQPGRYTLGDRVHDVGSDFGEVHIALADRFTRLAPAGMRLVQVSALGAGDTPAGPPPSRYLRSKTAAEELIQASALDWTLVRPSVVFGEGDHLLTTFADMQGLLPVMAVPRARARFQPVWVGDLAAALADCVIDPRGQATRRGVFDAVGPTVLTLAELIRLAGAYGGHRRPVIGLPTFVGKTLATLMELAPGPTPLSRDNIDSMAVDNIAGRDARLLLPVFGITPSSIEDIAPTYLGQPATFYDRARRRAHW